MNMKNKPKNSVFNFEYLDNFKDFLSKGPIDQESKIVLCRRLLKAILATEVGAQDEHYRFIKKNPTEHKSLEYIIELFLKKEDSNLQNINFDYSQGIFEVMRSQGACIKSSAIHVLQLELERFLTRPQASLEELATKDLFDDYRIILDNLLQITTFNIAQLEPTLNDACQLAINQICSLCDQLKYAAAFKTITDAKLAMRVNYMLDLHYETLSDVWGGLRLSFLRLLLRRHTVELIKLQKDSENSQHSDAHGASCECCQHETTL